MKKTLTAVNATHAEFHPRSENISAPNVVIVPKPTAVSAMPTPGTDTAPSTRVIGGLALATAGIERSGATRNRARRGSSIVASAIAAKP
jgi:hypothetical protein